MTWLQLCCFNQTHLMAIFHSHFNNIVQFAYTVCESGWNKLSLDHVDDTIYHILPDLKVYRSMYTLKSIHNIITDYKVLLDKMIISHVREHYDLS